MLHIISALTMNWTIVNYARINTKTQLVNICKCIILTTYWWCAWGSGVRRMELGVRALIYIFLITGNGFCALQSTQIYLFHQSKFKYYIGTIIYVAFFSSAQNTDASFTLKQCNAQYCWYVVRLLHYSCTKSKCTNIQWTFSVRDDTGISDLISGLCL